MSYVARCCGVRVLGRLVWLALGVLRPEEKCPVCGRWTVFEHESIQDAKTRRAA